MIDVEALYTAARELTTDLLPRLQLTIGEKGTILESSLGSHAKHIAAPIPWNEPAALLYLEIHGDTRRYENLLTLRLFQHAKYRPGTDEHTTESISRLPVLIAHGREKGLSGMDLDDVTKALTTWPIRIRAQLDEPREDELRWAKAPGGLVCPYCDKALEVPPGWDKASTAPDLLCRRCSDADGHHRRYAPDLWLGLLQDDPDQLTQEQAIAQYAIVASTFRSWLTRGRITHTGTRNGRRIYARTDIDTLTAGSISA